MSQQIISSVIHICGVCRRLPSLRRIGPKGAHGGKRMAFHDAREKNRSCSSCFGCRVWPGSRTGQTWFCGGVGGTSMTTLRLTLQDCPVSALAVRFNESKWPSDGMGFGDGLWTSSFSSMTDVLCMRKSGKWAICNPQKGCGSTTYAIEISAGVRLSFEKFMGMYCPGCERFVMEWVLLK